MVKFGVKRNKIYWEDCIGGMAGERRPIRAATCVGAAISLLGVWGQDRRFSYKPNQRIIETALDKEGVYIELITFPHTC
jgi:hypothetical protein